MNRLLAIALLVTACGGNGATSTPMKSPPAEVATQPPASPSPASVELSITSPQDGAISDVPDIVVRGTAPVGAEVTLNNYLGFGEPHVTATDGTWSMDVSLDEGGNEISLWLGDDLTTSRSITVTYRP